MTIQTHYDSAMLRGPRSVPVIARLGGGTIATVGDNNPFRVAGNEAVVYQLRQATGKVLALRVWLADEIDPDLVARYRALGSPELLRTFRSIEHSPIVHTLAYHSDAVLVESDDGLPANRPMVVLDWLMGPTILAAVDRACRANDGTYLKALANAWRLAMIASRAAGFVHGDLTADNAIVRPKEGIAFVDYDTAYWHGAPSVPEYVQSPAYRHRGGLPAAPDHADDFSALLIYTSLRVLAVWPNLRLEHGQPSTVKGAGLLFQPRDLANPDASPLFGKMRVLNDPAVLGLVSVLREASMADQNEVPSFAEALELAEHIARTNPAGALPRPQSRRAQSVISNVAQAERGTGNRSTDRLTQPIDQPFAEQSWPAHQKAWNPDILAELAEAIGSKDLVRAEAAWAAVQSEPGAGALVPALYRLRNSVQISDGSAPLRRHDARAIERKDVVRRSFANALDTNNAELLADLALSGDLDDLDDMSEASTRRVVAALAVQHLERAMQSDDDTLILEAYDEIIMAPVGVLTSEQRNRIDLAFDRKRWQSDVRAALRRRDRAAIDRLREMMPEGADHRLTARELVRLDRLREQDDAVNNLQDAIANRRGEAVVGALQQVERLGAWLPEDLVWADISDVVDRHTLIHAIRSASEKYPRDYARLARLLPQLRDVCGGQLPASEDGLDLDMLDREVRQVAQFARLREALASNDDRLIVATALPDLYQIIPKLDRGEQARIERAVAAVNRALRRSGHRDSSSADSSSTVDTV